MITSLYWASEWSGEMVNDPGEGQELAFFSPEDLPSNMDEEYRIYIRHYLGEKE